MNIQKKLLLQLLLAAIASLTALSVPFLYASSDQAIGVIKHWGFWLTLGTVLLFIFELRTPIKHLTAKEITSALRRHWPAVVITLFATSYLHLHIDRSFKILYDEYVLSSTAMNLYEDSRAFVQVSSHQMNGEVIAQAGFVDKRPLLFPFTVAMVHQLTGFRVENVFWLNSGLTLLLLLLIYGIVQKMCNRRYALCSVLLFVSLPLLAQNTTGGGYELLNLCLIASLIIAGIHYLESNETDGLNLLILTAVLAACTRYESLLYTLVPTSLWVIKSIQIRQFRLTWIASISPLLLITPLLTYAIFQSDERFIHTTADNFFRLKYLPSNFIEATHYLFNTTSAHSNSLLLSSVGCLAIICLYIACLKQAKRENSSVNPQFIATAAVFSIVGFNSVLALSSDWGAWTDPMTSRFSLPLQMFFAITPPLALFYCFNIRKLPRWPLALCIAFTVSMSSATSIRIHTETRMLIAKGNNWTINWLTENIPDKSNLIISDGTIGIQLYHYPAIPITVANSMPERVMNLKQIEFYDHIYVVESFVDFGSNYEIMPPPSANRLSERFALKHLAQKAFSKNSFYRISEITDLRNADSTNATLPQNLPPTASPQKDDPDAFIAYLKEALPLIPHR
ncbi:MAG: glycosyltransferase family 39 protein [Lentimonas sp.]